MNKPINRKTDKIENYRTYRITPPTELEPLYDKLQALEDTILTTRKYRDALLQLDPHAPLGKYWLSLKDIIRPKVRELDIANKTWYAYNVIENLRQVQLSLLDKQKAYDLMGRGVIIRVPAGSEASLLGGSRPVGYSWGDPSKF